HAGIVLEAPDCTLLQYNALYGGRPALEFIARKFMGINISKAEQTSDWSVPDLREEQIRYAAVDAWVVKIAQKNFEKWMAGKKQESIYTLMRDAQYAVAKMEYYGMNFDAVGHLTLIEQWKKDLQAAEKAFRDAVGPGVLLSSTKQLSDFFKARLDKATLKRWETNKSGDLCLDKNAVHRFKDIKVVAPLAEYKRLSTLVGSFGDKLLNNINPKTGRLHAEYNFAGAKTGRFSCSNPNLQQIPRDEAFRGLFKAPEGKVLVVADYSQIELRVLAMLSEEPAMLANYENGGDLHRLTASKITGDPLDKVSDEHRRMAKAINFGLVFGMGARSLADYARNTYGVTMTNKQAKEARDAYFESYPVVVRWQHKVTKASQTYNNAATRMGRVIKLNPEKVYTQSKNYPVQGSAADVMLAALKIVDREITRQELDIRIVCCVHDEIHLEAPEDLAEQAKSLLEECMVAGMLEIFPEASTKNLVEAAVGKSWGEAK
ncbi:DNA polymerase, partial [Halomonas sp.]|uniref:DNA polymerase n=1 Tax=Halomonas sp. TaxID=1486246 RepID=UPI0025BD2DFC